MILPWYQYHRIIVLINKDRIKPIGKFLQAQYACATYTRGDFSKIKTV